MKSLTARSIDRRREEEKIKKAAHKLSKKAIDMSSQWHGKSFF